MEISVFAFLCYPGILMSVYFNDYDICIYIIVKNQSVSIRI